MTIVRAREIEEQVARAGGDGRRICSLCKKKDLALCHMGTMVYDDGSERICPNWTARLAELE